MKTLWLLVCDDVRAKIYRTTYPPGELTLIYHQLNFGGHVVDFASSLARLLNTAHRSGTFDGLAVMASSKFLGAFDLYLNADCHGVIVGRTILDAGHHTNLELVSRLSSMLAVAPAMPVQIAS